MKKRFRSSAMVDAATAVTRSTIRTPQSGSSFAARNPILLNKSKSTYQAPKRVYGKQSPNLKLKVTNKSLLHAILIQKQSLKLFKDAAIDFEGRSTQIQQIEEKLAKTTQDNAWLKEELEKAQQEIEEANRRRDEKESELQATRQELARRAEDVARPEERVRVLEEERSAEGT
ncbi:hypothetical protein VNI00_012920 [Paramarasmius palmivorus]|uniref:Uncharacterized protein n=1 Tax=Paramarasmius palmivorus TaxID=297713 RepID=A0AAW0C158_9AGAR